MTMTGWKKGDKVCIKQGRFLLPAVVTDVKLGRKGKTGIGGSIIAYQAVIAVEVETLVEGWDENQHRVTQVVQPGALQRRYSTVPELDYAPTEESEKSE